MRHTLLVSLFGLCAILLVAGCDSSKGQPAKVAEPAAKEKEAVVPSKQFAEAVASLPPEEIAAVDAQQVCVVSGEPLGSMGTPIKMTANGKTAYLCCDGCTKTFESDPDKYLAKLKK